ncbi:MAG: formate dehydrogenase accessory protein FdhE [Syntrophomonadaceae bacterium]|nr:formate dehydrogenase accessory protein FdhE [Syntrophomonadaceae bacterium]
MSAKRGKLAITEDVSVKEAYQKHQMLKQEVDNWHQERCSHWQATLVLAKKPPYLPIMDLPEDAIVELWQRLNSAAKVEITDSTLFEMWEQLKQGKNDMDPSMATRLQMAVSGVAKLASQIVYEKGVPEQKYNPRTSDNPMKNTTECPVCGEVSTLAVLAKPEGKRMMHCVTCGFEWPVQRTGCLFCGSEDSKRLIYLDNEAFPGIQIAVCEVCGQYFKEIDERKLPVKDYVWEDLRTLPLNYAAELWLEEQIKRNNQIN